MAIPAPYYTTLEVEAILGVSSHMLHRWRARRVGPEFYSAGRAFRYPVRAFKSYVRMVTRGGANFDSMSTAERWELFRSFHSPRKPKPEEVAARKLAAVEGRLSSLEIRFLAVERAFLRLRAKS